MYRVELSPVLEVFEICVVRVPLRDKFEDQLSAREGGGAQHGLCQALVAGELLERDDGMLAKLLDDVGEARRCEAAKGGGQDLDSTWSAVEEGIERHPSTVASCAPGLEFVNNLPFFVVLCAVLHRTF